jgi:hypothetical protein
VGYWKIVLGQLCLALTILSVTMLRLGCAIPGFSTESHGTGLFIPGNTSASLIPTIRGGECEALAVSFNRLPDLPEVLTQGKERELLDWPFDNKAEYLSRIT